LRPNDIVIAILGVTGAGKTTFVSHFSTFELEIGHGLEPCTERVQAIPCEFEDGQRMWLVDTPGFDDTYRSDAELLEELATWLNSAYRRQIQLTGIVYLHRIKDIRIGGAAIKNLRMFNQLCGEHGLGSVVLATTMWDSGVDEQAGLKREQELTSSSDFWKLMIEQGSKVFRQDEGRTSAYRIVKYLINKNRPVYLDISREMVDEKKQLRDTKVGSEIATKVDKMKQHYEAELDRLRKELRKEVQNAVEQKNAEAKRQYELAQAEMRGIEKELAKNREDCLRLAADNEQLRQSAQAKDEKDLEEMRLLKSLIQEQRMQIDDAKRQNDKTREYDMEKKRKQSEQRLRQKEAMSAKNCIVM
ncbi:P-loop containing nucleoside triphosphate hydrolase protein, partial [Lophiotrema nucula]